jgi:ketosteroid isomerase-like protein
MEPTLFAIRTALFSLLLALATQTLAATDEANVEQEVLASFQSLVDASRRLDVQAYFAHFDQEKFVGLNNNGSTWATLEAFYPVIENGFAAIDEVTELRFTKLKVLVIDRHTAVLVNEFEQTMRMQNGNAASVAGGGSQVWSKSTGAWKLVSIATSIKQTSH